MPKRGADVFQCGGAGKIIIPGKTPTIPAMAFRNENDFVEITCPKLEEEPAVVPTSYGNTLRRKCKMNGKTCPYDTREY